MLQKRSTPKQDCCFCIHLESATDEQLISELQKRISTIERAPQFAEADNLLGGSRFHLRGGLRSPEVLMLRRALGTYISAYEQSRKRFTESWELQQTQDAINAAHQLDERLLRDLERFDPT